MNMKNKSILKRALMAAVIAAVAIGCGDKGSVSSETDRTKDPQYIKALEEQRTEQKKFVKEFSEAKAALQKAIEAKANAEEIAELKKLVDDARLKIEKNRLQSQAIVRARILAEQEAIKKKGK